MLHIQDIKRNTDGLAFQEEFNLLEDLQKRNPEILDLKHVVAEGRVRYEDGLYFLDYDLSYTITLASSRSLEPVVFEESYPVQEVFMEEEGDHKKEEWIEDDLILVIEGNQINLAESVGDNILLNVPLKVLTPEEEAGQGMAEGQSWKVLTEEEYQRLQDQKKESNNPFAGLNGLFEEE